MPTLCSYFWGPTTSGGEKKIKPRSFHQYSWNSEVEITWISLIGWHRKTSSEYTSKAQYQVRMYVFLLPLQPCWQQSVTGTWAGSEYGISYFVFISVIICHPRFLHIKDTHHCIGALFRLLAGPLSPHPSFLSSLLREL